MQVEAGTKPVAGGGQARRPRRGFREVLAAVALAAVVSATLALYTYTHTAAQRAGAGAGAAPPPPHLYRTPLPEQLAKSPPPDAPAPVPATEPPPPDAPVPVPAPRRVASGLRPRIYVYDLPHALREPCLWPLTCRLHEAVAASGHRTLDGDEADYYWIPHKMPVTNDTELRAILRIVVHDYPWFNATTEARHVMVFSCDHGPSPCTWESPACADARGLQMWPAAVNPASPERRLMFVTLNGWRDVVDDVCCRSCFQAGRDIVVPPLTPGREWNPDVARAKRLSPWLGTDVEATAFVDSGRPRDGAPPRDVLLWFAGALDEGASAPANDVYGRAAPFAAFGAPNARDDGEPPLQLELLNTRTAPRGDKSATFEDWAPRSLFCLDPQGTHGGWAARVVALLYYGCVPLNTRPADVALIFDEHPDVNWTAWSVAVRSPMGAGFNATLRAALAEARTPAALTQRRAAARQVYTRLLWSSLAPGGSVAGEPRGDGHRDAWDTLMEILAARVHAPLA